MGWKGAEMDVGGAGKRVSRWSEAWEVFMEEMIMQFEECVSS